MAGKVRLGTKCPSSCGADVGWHISCTCSSGLAELAFFVSFFLLWCVYVCVPSLSLSLSIILSFLPFPLLFIILKRSPSPPQSTFSAGSLNTVHPHCAVACYNTCAHVKDPVVHVRVRWIRETLKTPNMHRRLGSATLSHLAFPGKGNPNFPWEKSHWDNTVVKSKKKKERKKSKSRTSSHGCPE